MESHKLGGLKQSANLFAQSGGQESGVNTGNVESFGGREVGLIVSLTLLEMTSRL